MIEPKSLPTDRDVAAQSTAAAYQPFRAFDQRFARISWGSVFAGAIIALATQLVLTLIGIAIGLATISPATGDTPSGSALGLGGTLWLVISSLIALFFGGYIAARVGGSFNGWLHGLTTWGTVTILTLLLLTTAAGTLVGAASGLANFVVSNSDKGSQLQLPPAVQQQLDQLKSRARQSADQAITQAQQTNQQQQAAEARQTGERAAKGGALGAGGAALGLILGALAAAFGAKAGQRYPVRDAAAETRYTHVATGEP